MIEQPKVEETFRGKTSFSLREMAEIRKRAKELTVEWKPLVRAGFFERRMFPDFACNNSRNFGKDDRKDNRRGDRDRGDRDGKYNNKRGGDHRNDRNDRHDRNDRGGDQRPPYQPRDGGNQNSTGGGRSNENSQKLKQQSKQMEVRMATAEKETIDRKAKLALNKITNENYAKIKPQIKDIYFEAESEDDKKMFTKVFFLKACHEQKYTELYIDLIRFLAREEARS